jgi:hypothetical protein
MQLPALADPLRGLLFVRLAVCSLMLLAAGIGSAWAQEPAASSSGQAALRKLAPGVVTEIGLQIEEEETFSGPREFVELVRKAPELEWKSNFLANTETLLAMSRDVVFRRQVWALEFGFKPMRMLDVAVRGSDGQTRTQRVWYLVYYVKNQGRHLNPTPERDEQGHELYTPKPVNHSVRFFPSFQLQCHDVDQAYLDEVIPSAIEVIRKREDPNRKFYDSVNISSVQIPVSTEFEDNSVWGIATWTGVDPRSDFFSVFVQGLTNAYRWQDAEAAAGADTAPLAGRRFSHKTLQLNFWRPGDAEDPSEEEIRYGVPNRNQVPAGKLSDEILKMYGLKERVDHLWVYR